MQNYINGEEIYKIDTLADGLRSTGYKTTYNAIAEIVDNSIEENASHVFIIGTQDLIVDQQRITKFAFLDDGNGMNEDILSKCLQIGFSTRAERKGMGRFGVGLPQASFSVSPKVEVYSWQNGIENVKRVFIDLDLVTEGQQTRIFGPEVVDIPDEYRRFIRFSTEDKTYDFSSHGTLVVWPKCDTVTHKKWNTCKRKIAEDLGRKYRWMLSKGEVEISTVESNDLSSFESILPNDPLFLMKKSIYSVKPAINDNDCNCLPYNEEEGYTESMFEPFATDDNPTGVVDKEVYYFTKDGVKHTSTVKIRFSIVKEKYYDKHIITKDPGSLPYGKCAKANSGISIVRQNREIDFGYFDFVEVTNNPYHRWWGCEISFTPELDEAFGISNNKQQVILKEIDDAALADYDGDEPMWVQLRDTIRNNINKMVAINKDKRAGSRSNESGATATTAVSEIIKEAENENPDIKVEPENKPETITEEIKNKVIEELEQEGFIDVTVDQVAQYLDSNTRIKYVNYGARNSFIDYEDTLGVLKVIVNKDHSFYRDFVSEAYQTDEMKLMFELFLASLIKSIYSLHATNATAMDNLIDGINDKLKDYLKRNN